MLERLTIQNYALIESLDIEFPDGLVIMTGETGAGKSVLLGAVSLLKGGKADSSVLRDAQKNCVVEAVFSAGGVQTILRRVTSPLMRSRFFIDDEPVSASKMADISSRLMDIHSQHSNLILTDRKFQLEMIDSFCSTQKLLGRYEAEHNGIKELERAVESIAEKIDTEEKERQIRSAELHKLQEAQLKEGEQELLEQEQMRLEHSETLKENALSAIELLDGEAGSVLQSLRAAVRNVEHLAEFDSGLGQLAKRLESCRVECKDIVSDLEKFSSAVEDSPMRLAQVQQRLDDLYSLMRRFSCNDVSSLIALKDSLLQSETDLEDLKEEKSRLEKQLAAAVEKRKTLSEELSSKRRAGAHRLEKMLQESIRSLEMPDARIVIELVPTAGFVSDGVDDPHILFSANPKEKLVELDKVASGGELSRIMLCIKSLMSGFMQMPTVFFDEIDVGVSGSVADKMGRQIVNMGRNMQVVAITHLPQVASKGAAHLLVYKDNTPDGRNTVRLRTLEGKDRVMEIARLLSGENTTVQAIANAEVLLGYKSDN